MQKSGNWKDIAELVGLVAIVLSLVLVAYELRQNTMMMKAQTRDSLTGKQMMFSEWVATNRYAAEVSVLAEKGELQPGSPEYLSSQFLLQGIFRAYENSFYQYEQGLFELEDFEPRRRRWRQVLARPSVANYWKGNREQYSPNFRAEIDSIVRQLEAN